MKSMILTSCPSHNSMRQKVRQQDDRLDRHDISEKKNGGLDF